MTQRYDAAALQRLLPHRYPLLLVDTIEVVEPGRLVRGLKQVTSGECAPLDDGPPAMPFTLVLEAAAQTTGALIPDLAAGMSGAIAYFMGANHVRVRRPARAGDTLGIEVRLVQWKRGICRTAARVVVEQELVLSATLVTIVRANT